MLGAVGSRRGNSLSHPALTMTEQYEITAVVEITEGRALGVGASWVWGEWAYHSCRLGIAGRRCHDGNFGYQGGEIGVV